MEEKILKLTYYQRNKEKYKKGGKYYKYIRKDERHPELKFKVEKGCFLISFD